MNVAFIAPRFHTNQKNIVQYLLEESHQVTFYATNRGEIEDYSDLKPTIIDVNLITKIINKIIPSKDEFYEYNKGIPSIRSLWRFLKNKHDLVIIRNPNRVIPLVYSIFSRILGIKIVFYSQMDLYRKPNKRKDFMIKLFLKLFDATWITPCLGDISFTKVDNRIKYLPFSARANLYQKQWFRDDVVNIIDIGKFEIRKNHHILIKALLNLQHKYKFKLTIIGEATKPHRKKYFEEIKHLIKDCNFQVECINNIPLNDVFEYYKKSDLFILPAINEQASVSNLEAMSFGLPIITSDTNKTSCYTVEGVNGFIFKSEDVLDLKNKIENIIKDRNKLIEMGQKSYEILKKNHLAENIYGDFFNSMNFIKDTNED